MGKRRLSGLKTGVSGGFRSRERQYKDVLAGAQVMN